MAIWGIAIIILPIYILIIIPTAWILYMAVLFIMVILLAALIISMVFSDIIRSYILNIITSLL